MAQAPQEAAWQPGPGHVTVALWPDGPPGHPPSPGPEKDVADKKNLIGGKPVVRITNVSVPSITLYAPPAGKANGAAVVVMPGGSYTVLAIDKEGSEICDWLNSIGVTAILLKYRVPDTGPYPKSRVAYEDGQRAMGLVREHAAEWHIDPHRIGALGFSAGAHLGVVLSNLCAQRIYPRVDAADDQPCRPDFAVVIYPGWLGGGTGGQLKPNPAIPIDPKGPPALIIQAENDPVHVENSLTYFLALKSAGIPAEMHLYALGGHGYGMRPTGLPIAQWPRLAATWFDTIGITRSSQ
jgi:acetyl esterase/lipase